MTKLFYRILLAVLNLFGILNLKVTNSGLIRNSKLCVTMNFVKAMIIMYFNNYFKTVIYDHFLTDYPSYELTTFAEFFFAGNTVFMYFNTIMLILLQIWKRKDILKVIEEMLLLKSLFIKKYKVAEKHYNQIERICIRDILLFFFGTFVVFLNDFLCNMNLNFKSFVAYVIFSFPYMTIILMTLIVYLSIQFVAISQKILIDSLAEGVIESSIANDVEGIGYELGNVVSLFKQINNILNIQVALMVLYYLTETIVQV